MKKWMVISMVAVFGSISYAADIIDKWDYSGAADNPSIEGVLSTSDLGGGGEKWVDKSVTSIESGAVKFTKGSDNGYFVNRNPTVSGISGATSGEFECSWDFPSMDFSNTAALDQKATWAAGIRGAGNVDVAVRLHYEGQLNVTNVLANGAGTNIYANADQIQLMVKDANNNWMEAAVFPGHTLSDLSIRLNYNLFAGTFDAYYTLGAASEVNFHNGSLVSGWSISTYRILAQFDNGGSLWEAGDELFMNNLAYTQVQEPFDPPALTVIDYWGYEGLTNGAGLSEAASTGFVGGVIFSDATPASITNLVDGAVTNCALRLTSNELENESMFRTASPSLYSGNSTGVYEVVMDVLSVDFTETAAMGANGTFGFEVRDASNKAMGLHLLYHGGNDEIQLQFEDASGKSTIKAIPGHIASNIQMRFLMDLGQAGTSGSAQFFYTIGGVEAGKYDGTVHTGYDFAQYRLRAQPINGGNGWKIGDVSLVDNLKVEKVASLETPPVYVDIVDYQMDDGAGTLLNALAQIGTDAGQFQGTDAFIATDGIGSLVVSPVTESVTRKHFMGTTFTEGLNRLEFALDDWNLDATTDGSSVKFALVDDTGTNQVQFGIDVNTNNATVRFRAAANNGGDAGQGLYDYGYVASTGVVLRIDVNLEAGNYSASWKYDNGDEFIGVVGAGSLGQLANIAELRLAVADTGWDAADFVNVDYLVFSTTSDEAPWTPDSRYAAWLDAYPGLGASTNLTDNPDGDLLDNLSEYALGGDPTDGNDVGNKSTFQALEDGGANYLEYVYAERTDNATANRGLTYFLETTTDLIIVPWANAGYVELGTGIEVFAPGFDAVTNRVSTDVESKRFIRLQVEFTP